ncbi:MAG TPA: hypothetical protein VMI52_06775, partial [Acetobacteraceae bacterium]|nr:hypothetical protein [Acetobacteraceae bacterium]
YAVAADPRLRFLADDGEAIVPQAFGAWLCLALPEGTRRLRLASQQVRPAEFDRTHPDPRRLGVAVAELRLDDRPVPLDDPRLCAGWHAPEPGLRWTDGAALIDVTGTSLVELRTAPIALPYVGPVTAQVRAAAG